MNLAARGRKVGKFWGDYRTQVAKKEIARGFKGASSRLVEALKTAAPVAGGELREGIHAEFFRGGMVVKVVQDPWYGIAVDAGAVASFSPVQPLVEWVELKIGASGQEAERIAYAIIEDHSKLGRDPQPYWYVTFDKMIPILNSQYLGPVGAAIVKELE